MTINDINKKISLGLVGLDGNAFALLCAFSRQARREKWTAEEIKTVLDECEGGNYNHLLATLVAVCESPDKKDADND